MTHMWCWACREDRHSDCAGTIECTCYAYGEAHADPPVDPAYGTSVLETAKRFLEHDLEKDLGDGGLGSGRWLMGEMP